MRPLWTTVPLLLKEGQATIIPSTNSLARVLGNGHAFLRLTGPRAVTIKNGLGRWNADLLTAIRRLRTVLNSVSRIPVGVWPTLLVNMKPVNIGFRPIANPLLPRSHITALIILVGSKLGANRICENRLVTRSDSAPTVSAPVKLGIFLKRTRLLSSKETNK